MPRYSKELNDALVDDIDVSWVGVNDYARPDQLPQGMLSYSENGRIEGSWQVRAGIDLIAAPLATDERALTLPFITWADETGNGVSRSGDTVTVTFASDHDLKPRFTDELDPDLVIGQVLETHDSVVGVSGITGGTPDPNGNRVLTDAYVLSNTELTFPTADPVPANTWYRESLVPSSSKYNYSSSDQSSTTTISPIGSPSPDLGWRILIQPVGLGAGREIESTEDVVSPDLVTTWVDVTSGETFNSGSFSIDRKATFDVSGLTGTLAGTPVIGSPYLQDDLVNGVFGSCSFSDPSDEDSAYIIIAGNNNAQAINLADNSTTTIEYPTDLAITGEVDMIQALHKVFIFRDGEVALEWDGDISGGLAFTEVANGEYSQPILTSTTNNTTITDGNVEVSAVAHGYSVGDSIYIVDAGGGPLLDAEVDHYTVQSVPDADNFKFRATVDDTPAHTVSFMKRQSVGLGFSHMPSPPWAVYFGWRLVMPFRYTMAGTSGSPSIVSREIYDELIISDILDPTTYDQIYGQFRFNAGTSDYLVGLQGFADDKLLVFNRNSIHLVQSNGSNTENASSQLLTQEVGLIARKSVQQIGDQVIFLSDNGVYGASFVDLYNLRGNSIPLSKDINGLIGRINKAYARKAVSAYYNNRYYLAVPLDGSIVNNAILVFNFLNKGWESVDTVDDINWNISNLIVDGIGSDRGLYAVNSLGGVHKLEARYDDRDLVATTIGSQDEQKVILGKMETRGYTLNSLERKKWNSYELHIESSPISDSDATISAEYENIDAEVSYGDISGIINKTLPANEDISIRGRFGNRRGYSNRVKFHTKFGRPKVRAVRVRGAVTFRSTNPAE